MNNPNNIVFPNGLDNDNIETLNDTVSEMRARDFNTLRQAILKIENELGINPSGIHSAVRSRLDNIEKAVGIREDYILSAYIAEADGISNQDTNVGAGIKTGHIQDGAITSNKIPDDTVVKSIITGSSTYQDDVQIVGGSLIEIDEDTDGFTIKSVIDGYHNLFTQNIQHRTEFTPGVDGAYNIDMDGVAVRTIEIAGATSFAATNLTDNVSKNVSVIITAETGDGDSILSFDSDWVWVGKKPENLLGGWIEDGYAGLLSILTSGENVIAAYEDVGDGT